MPKAKNFYENVYQVTRQIPYGRVTSYGAIAKAIGAPKSARVVGYALQHSPRDVPAHRVLNRNGVLTGKHHFPGENLMQQLLENEGLIITENQVQNFEKHFWKPEIQ